jgi:hypothetical protein
MRPFLSGRNRFSICLIILFAYVHQPRAAGDPVRRELRIPDLDGRVTLKCDFHVHTVFSDGTVWPTLRVKEAWMDGLDALAVTDHLEHQAHSDDLKADRNRSYDIARKEGDAFGLIVIRGTEITRRMPPGHFNALFITDAEALNLPEWRDVLAAARAQGAFVFWNHPGWQGQQSGGIAKWYDEHTEILEKGWMQGMEAVNGEEYYPEVHRWCVEKKLVMLGNSDLHDPERKEAGTPFLPGRPVTLVFAGEKSEDGIRQALFEKRTAVCFKGDLFGQAEDLNALFEKSVRVRNPSIQIKRNGRKAVSLTNDSDLHFRLIRNGEAEGFSGPEEVSVPAGCTAFFNVRALRDPKPEGETVSFPYRAVNLRTAPEESLPVSIRIVVYPQKN